MTREGTPQTAPRRDADVARSFAVGCVDRKHGAGRGQQQPHSSGMKQRLQIASNPSIRISKCMLDCVQQVFEAKLHDMKALSSEDFSALHSMHFGPNRDRMRGCETLGRIMRLFYRRRMHGFPRVQFRSDGIW